MAPSGSYAIGWSQVTLDGVPGADMASVRTGLAWRWAGRALRLDGPAGVLRLDEPPEWQDLRRRARRGAARFVPGVSGHPEPEPAVAGPAITVTDGRRSWRVALVPGRHGARPIAHFEVPPPPGRDLWIARVEGAEALVGASTAPEEWHGIAARTLVDTPEGQVPVEMIGPGHRVLTPEGGTAVVGWTMVRAVSGARMCVAPRLAPVRVGGVLMAPDQGIVAEGTAARALFPGGAVAMAARDAADGRVVRGVPGMVAHVVVLTRPGAFLSGGLAIDGSLPAALRKDCGRDMGDALRRLTPGEAAILRGARD
jgi:hypothetical protein